MGHRRKRKNPPSTAPDAGIEALVVFERPHDVSISDEQYDLILAEWKRRGRRFLNAAAVKCLLQEPIDAASSGLGGLSQ